MKNENNQRKSKALSNRIKGFYDPQCVKLAGIVGTGIHLYSTAVNSEHFRGIYEDFASGQYIKGTLKAAVPFLLPYGVSLYSRKKAQREVQDKIYNLEEKIRTLEG